MSLGTTARRILAGAIAAIVATPLVMLACGVDSNSNYVDAFDTPAGGLLVNPGIVTCGFLDAGCRLSVGECCLGPGAMATCADAAEPTQCPTSAASVGCNETADCLVGNLCCGTPPASGAEFLSAQCATSCPAPQIQLCRTNGECGSDKCIPQRCSDGLVYELCEHYSSPTFACTVLGLLADGGLDLGDSAGPDAGSPDGAAPDAAGDDSGSLDAAPGD